MTASTTSNGDRTAPTNQDSNLLDRGRSYVRRALGRGRTGTIALLVGGALLVRSRRAKTRGRGAIQALAGLGFLALGIRQRLARNGSFETQQPGDDSGPGDGDDTGRHIDTAATTAHAQGEDTNPRDVTEDPAVETETESGDGSVRFTTDQNDGPSSNPTLDETEADPRVREDDGVDIDISESAMADEPSEAVGPQAEQAQPASTEATEPDPDPPADHPRGDAGDGRTGEETPEDKDTHDSSADDTGDESPEGDDETDKGDAERAGADETEDP